MHMSHSVVSVANVTCNYSPIRIYVYMHFDTVSRLVHGFVTKPLLKAVRNS